MTVFKKFNYKDYRKAVEEAVKAGHKIKARTWDGVEFEHFTIRHVEEVK